MFVKKIIILLMVLLLIVAPVRNCYAAAEAATISIVGGSVAAGGIGAAVATVAPYAAVIVAIALAAQGIYILVSDEAEQAGMTKIDYLEEQLAIYADAAGNTFDEICNNIVSGANVFADGVISITEDASNIISRFVNRLLGTEQILAPSSVSSYVMVGGVQCPVITSQQMIEVYAWRNIVYGIQNISSSSEYVVFYTKVENAGRYDYYLLSTSSRFQTKWYENGREYGYPEDHYGTEYDGLYLFSIAGQNIRDITANYVPEVSDVISSVEGLNGNFDVVEASSDGFFSDDVSSIDSSVYVPDEGKVIVIDPGLGIDTIANDYGRAGTISIDNYLESLKRAIDGVSDNTIAINDSLTGVLENVAVGTYDPVGSASVAQENEEDLPLVMTPVLDLSLNPSGSAAQDALKSMQFDLTGIFPFCIPFDLYALIQKFDVEPVTPNVHLVIPLCGIDEDLVFDLDLSPFETVAQVLRTMELIAFVVGLAMVTRNMIRG